MSMSVEGLAELHLPRTFRIQAAGHTLVLAKRAGESTAHVLLKACAYARYLPQYSGLRVEVPIGGRYKPDLVALDTTGEPLVWIECGHADADKIRKLLRRYPHTRFVWFRRFGQWESAVRIVRAALIDSRRIAAAEVIGVTDATLRTLAESGNADTAIDDLHIITLPDTPTDAIY